MNSPAPPHEATIWTGHQARDTVAALMDLMGDAIVPLAVGGPHPQTSSQLAKTLGCPAENDLRKLLVDRPAAYLLLTTTQGVTAQDLANACRQGTTVLSTEPIAADWTELEQLQAQSNPRAAESLWTSPTLGRIVAVPRFDQSHGYLAAAEPLDALGQPLTVTFQSMGTPETGSLLGRLFDAWRVVLNVAEMPMTVDAALLQTPANPPPDQAGEAPPSPTPDQPRAITGRLTAHARMPDGSTALLHVADHAAQPSRSLDILGTTGQWHADDLGYELWQLDGTRLEYERPAAAATPPPPATAYAQLIAHQWRRLLERPALLALEPNLRREPQLLACCLACLLSARTAQPESPAQMLKMSR